MWLVRVSLTSGKRRRYSAVVMISSICRALVVISVSDFDRWMNSQAGFLVKQYAMKLMTTSSDLP